MYTNLYVYKAPSIYMAGEKALLYWRIKRPDGKWTFVPASHQLRELVTDLGYAPGDQVCDYQRSQ
jgi:hypothetical protein